MELPEVKAVIEGILFAAGAPVSLQRMAAAMDLPEETVQSVLRHMMDEYNFERRGIKLLRLENAYQLCSRPEYADYIRKALDVRREPVLSPAAMEVLSIVAYNQPVTRGVIEQLRGVDSSGVLGSLIEKGLIEERGTLDMPGRPRLYGVTSDFLRCFSLSSIDDLPELEPARLPEESGDAAEPSEQQSMEGGNESSPEETDR